MMKFMVDLKLLIRPFYRVGAYEILFLILFLALFPLAEIAALGWLLHLVEFYWLLAWLAGASLFFFFVGILFLKKLFGRIEMISREGLYPEKELITVLGTLFCFSMMIFPGPISSTAGLLLFFPPLRRVAGQGIVRYTGLSVKEIYEYKKIYEE